MGNQLPWFDQSVWLDVEIILGLKRKKKSKNNDNDSNDDRFYQNLKSKICMDNLEVIRKTYIYL